MNRKSTIEFAHPEYRTGPEYHKYKTGYYYYDYKYETGYYYYDHKYKTGPSDIIMTSPELPVCVGKTILPKTYTYIYTDIPL